ncbi:hypothetical protein CLI64_08410 [Nostoc sp. CENA543]|uniref:hypothetical protein n=1 Tax=Nostoc sp. CENA543 TaxID=1869241 RepID=UPI000CA0B9CB|nr:hypothetical protein [Nostoc sp. CENA543]AUT00409.1 hypothetical protein CLI64_08410 [Nostoc sp. CENA543]
MANITIDEIYSTGRDLFQDAESFLNELTHQTIEFIRGSGYSGFWGFGSYSNSYSQYSYNSFPRSGYSGGYGYDYGYGYGKWC